MIKKFVEWITSKTLAVHKKKGAWKRWWPQAILVAMLVLPSIAMAIFSYLKINHDLTAATYSRRQSIAYLAATILKERFDHLIDVAGSLASRVQFRKLIAEGKWSEAIKILTGVPKQFPSIERIGLVGLDGISRALTPDFPGIVEKNFSQRDWYKEVSKNWKPYVSEVFKGATNQNSAVIAVPIFAENGKVLGILATQIISDTLVEWADEIDVGEEGFAYFVDQRGHVAAHPKFPPQGEIVDFSQTPIVERLLRGEMGVGVFYNAIEKEQRLSAYEPVPGYGWGVVVAQPVDRAFAFRSDDLRFTAIIYGILFLLNLFFAVLILYTIRSLNEYRQRQNIFLESAGDGVFAIDRFWNITLWNKAASEITGFSQEKALGKPFRQIARFIGQDSRKENITFIEEAMIFGERRTMEDHTVVIRKDGKEIPVGDSAAPIFDSSGKVEGAIVVFRDVSQTAAEEKMKEDFLFQIVHDLRAPATGIKLVAENYGDAKFLAGHPEKLQEGVGLIQEANARMLGLINKLLESAKRGGMVEALKSGRVNLPELFREMLKEFQPRINAKKIKVKYSPPGDLPNASAAADDVKEIFTNLIDNAVKYVNADGMISIGQVVESNFVKTAISNTGPGIPPEKIAKLFQPYYRADGDGKVQGTGLGLYIVKNLVEKLGGKIEVVSSDSQGPTFTVYLPKAS